MTNEPIEIKPDDDDVIMYPDVPSVWPKPGDTVLVIYQDDEGEWHSRDVTFR